MRPGGEVSSGGESRQWKAMTGQEQWPKILALTGGDDQRSGLGSSRLPRGIGLQADESAVIVPLDVTCYYPRQSGTDLGAQVTIRNVLAGKQPV